MLPCLAAESSPAVLPVGMTRYLGAAAADGKVHAFLGIPFARPPVGEMRWAPPQDPETPPGEVAATDFAPACAQVGHMFAWYRGVVNSFGGDPENFPIPRTSEDCLYLNVWAPAGRGIAAAGLPVMVYIHGGSNKGGWSYEPNYIGENLARLGVVVVSIPYRLGVLGFFAHPELAHANFGLLDQVAALRWVQRNVAAVGGDTGNVTVVGESAGASDIMHLLVSPLARGLMQRVVHQSAGWALAERADATESRRRGLALQRELTGDNGDLASLRRLPAATVLDAAETVYAGFDFDPVVDGHSLLQPLAWSLRRGDFPAVDLLIGSNADEWLMYLDGQETVDDWLRENQPPQQHQRVCAALPASLSELQAVDRLHTALNFVCPSMEIARLVTENGGASWFYHFSRQRQGARAATMGAYHGAELPYVFDTHDDWLPTDANDRQLTRQIMAYWVNFARNGNPNSQGVSHWPLFEAASAKVQVLDVPVTTRAHGSLALCLALADVADQT